MLRTLVAMLLVTALLAVDSQAQRRQRRGGRWMNRQQPIGQVLENIPKAELNQLERADLVWMREEEKLAHDVYVALSVNQPLRPLPNIIRAETMHMQTVKALLDRYEVEDPVGERKAGVFASSELQTLYDSLAAKGERSVEDAIRVGLEIEELDIADLIKRIERADNDDIKVAYQNLMKGSRNHLRAFYRQAQRYNIEYAAQHLDQETFDAILLGDMERGQVIRDPNFAYPGKPEPERKTPSAGVVDDLAAED